MLNLPDVQSTKPFFQLPLKKVGIRQLQFQLQGRIAELSAYVALGPDQKGTHMSRIVQSCLGHLEGESSDQLPKGMRCAVSALRDNLYTPAAYVKVRTQATARTGSPATSLRGTIVFPWTVSMSSTGFRQIPDYVLETETEIPITTYCPCSKALVEDSDLAGIPHSQRGLVRITCRYVGDDEIEGSIGALPLYALVRDNIKTMPTIIVKRADELSMAVSGNSNPLFVEDVCRLVHTGLEGIDVPDFAIVAETFESIHCHNAVAVSCKGVKGGLR